MSRQRVCLRSVPTSVTIQAQWQECLYLPAMNSSPRPLLARPEPRAIHLRARGSASYTHLATVKRWCLTVRPHYRDQWDRAFSEQPVTHWGCDGCKAATGDHPTG